MRVATIETSHVQTTRVSSLRLPITISHYQVDRSSIVIWESVPLPLFGKCKNLRMNETAKNASFFPINPRTSLSPVLLHSITHKNILQYRGSALKLYFAVAIFWESRRPY